MISILVLALRLAQMANVSGYDNFSIELKLGALGVFYCPNHGAYVEWNRVPVRNLLSTKDPIQ